MKKECHIFTIKIEASCNNCVSAKSLMNGTGDSTCIKTSAFISVMLNDNEICKFWKPSISDMGCWIGRAKLKKEQPS